MTIATTLLQSTTALIAALSQHSTNGNSQLGTLHAPKLPTFLTNNPVVNGFPWGGSKNAWNSDGYYDAPNTGVVRSYDFTVARGTVAPDGYEKETLLINGQYPGPLIEANWGDTIQVTVHNQITNPPEGTTLHWHGQKQQNSEAYDGVPSVSMCPIAPGSSYTYSFQANPYGSSWYHSHYSSQYAGGLWGPMVIHGPRTAVYDVDLGPVTINDYFHRPYFEILEDVVGVIGNDPAKVRPASDNNLINGKMNFDCSTSTTSNKCTNNAGVSKFQFTSGKTHLLRIINTGTQAIQKFSIDNHMMTVIANDFVPVKPYNATVVTVAVGQRTDVLVKATGKPTDIVWMRSNIAQGQCTEPANQPLALASIYYEHANTTGVPSANSTAQVDTTDPCSNDDLAEQTPSMSRTPTAPAKTINMNVDFLVNATGHLVWTINNQTFRGDYNSPLLLLAKGGNTSYPTHPEWNVYNVGTSSSVRVIIKNSTPTSHPWHFHGHEVFILAAGTGTWDGTIVNPSNPARRDVQLLPANGYLVLQWNSDNAGVWPFHCHIAWHLSGGLYANILENPAGIKDLPIPSTSYQVCRDWAAFTGNNLPNQIDSGL
ncbi:MAG: hypothetical protein LQ338_002467 [Usnochroma carphineum]|nr:MAG: hypothetical protein LQ338_002467 [Usnochroma carphineum]